MHAKGIVLLCAHLLLMQQVFSQDKKPITLQSLSQGCSSFVVNSLTDITPSGISVSSDKVTLNTPIKAPIQKFPARLSSCSSK